jgi:hypothetical protein
MHDDIPKHTIYPTAKIAGRASAATGIDIDVAAEASGGVGP